MSRGLVVSATGVVTGAGSGGRIGSLSLAGGSATSTAVIREGGASGTIIHQLTGVTSTQGSTLFRDGIEYNGDLHVTLTGTGAALNIELL